MSGPSPPTTPFASGRLSLPGSGSRAAAARAARASLDPTTAAHAASTAAAAALSARNVVPPGLEVGVRVFVAKSGGVFGTVRFLGTTDFAPDVWAGLDLELPVGKNDGSIAGREYFDCRPNHGLFVRPAVCKVLFREEHHHQQPQQQQPAPRTRRPPFTSFTGRMPSSLTQAPPPPTATARAPAPSIPSASAIAAAATAATALRPHAPPPTVATAASGARSGGGRGNEKLMEELLNERVEELEQQVKAMEERMGTKLQQLVGKVVDRLTGLEERIDATVVEFKQAQQQRRQEQEEVAAAAATDAHQQQLQQHQHQQEEEHAQVLAVIQKLAQDAKIAILEGVQEHCKALALE